MKSYRGENTHRGSRNNGEGQQKRKNCHNRSVLFTKWSLTLIASNKSENNNWYPCYPQIQCIYMKLMNIAISVSRLFDMHATKWHWHGHMYLSHSPRSINTCQVARQYNHSVRASRRRFMHASPYPSHSSHADGKLPKIIIKKGKTNKQKC